MFNRGTNHVLHVLQLLCQLETKGRALKSVVINHCSFYMPLKRQLFTNAIAVEHAVISRLP